MAVPNTEIKPLYDVVVIGSGYGGSIAASRCARAGQSVCVLERGKEWRPGDFPEHSAGVFKEFQLTVGGEGRTHGRLLFRRVFEIKERERDGRISTVNLTLCLQKLEITYAQLWKLKITCSGAHNCFQIFFHSFNGFVFFFSLIC